MSTDEVPEYTHKIYVIIEYLEKQLSVSNFENEKYYHNNKFQPRIIINEPQPCQQGLSQGLACVEKLFQPMGMQQVLDYVCNILNLM